MISDDCFALALSFSETKSRMEFKLKYTHTLQSGLDSEINNILHIIEYVDLPATKMSKLTKKLKDLYKQRRINKEDTIVLQNILHHGKNAITEIAASTARGEKYKSESIEALTKMIGL